MTKKPKQSILDTLPPEQRNQIRAHFDKHTCKETADYSLQLLGERISEATLSRYFTKARTAEVLSARTGLKITPQTITSLVNGDPVPIDQAGLTRIQEETYELLVHPPEDHTPARLLQLQRIFDYNFRRQVTADRLDLAKRRATLSENKFAFQKHYAQVSLSVRCGYSRNIEQEITSLEKKHASTETSPITPKPSENPIHPEPQDLSTDLLSTDHCSVLPEIKNDEIPISKFPSDLRASASPRENTQPAPCELTPAECPLPPSTFPPPNFTDFYGPNTNARIQAALQLKPTWKVPINAEEMNNACTAYAQLRDKEKFPTGAPRITKYKYCPCGGPTPCPIHGSLPEKFWEMHPANADYRELTFNRGLDYQYQKPDSAGGRYVLVEGKEHRGPMRTLWNIG